MILLNNKIIDGFKNGKFIGIICAAIMPLLWVLIVSLSAMGIGAQGTKSAVIDHFFFVLFNQEALYFYFALITIIIINSFVHRVRRRLY